jgi:hypothetical protein
VKRRRPERDIRQHAGVEAVFVPVPLSSNANSDSGTVNREKPQSKQTESFGNSQMPGLSKFFRPEEWMSISAENSAILTDLHDIQDITNSYIALHYSESERE